jgi:hypothetical protein
MRAGADMVVGASARRSAPDITRAYRGIDHNHLRSRFNEARARSISANITQFVDAATLLQRERHKADYDPFHHFSKADAIANVRIARDAIMAFEEATADERKACLTLLLFKERRL